MKCPAGSISAVTAHLGGGDDEYSQYHDGIADTVFG